ncbi:hypothetical protein BCR42DRAFT_493273 [Absidia repens]|uniref:CCHC-type domain-containing protein n=1 Tax=Absidia repens TaxID=90262 RepID=A0A1X2IB88_9FUNG|nr:hypothetical protein BCR42DRAFT_493273 [Absidia repens]
MYDDDEEDLALLQQYEEEDANSSNDDLDSDLEDKIMSAVQYETDAAQPWPTKAQQQQEQDEKTQQEAIPKNGQLATRSIIPPIDMTKPASDTARPDSSSDDDSSISSYNGDDHSIENDDSLGNNNIESNLIAPPIIRHIDLNITDKQLQQDDSTDDEEKALNHELQELIDQQIRNRKQKQQSFRKSKQLPFCFSCLAPGHIQRDCSLCNECGGEKHPNIRCPGAFYCHRCKERGHLAMDCRNNRCYDSCRHCGEDYHASQCCPTLVHVYRDQVSPKLKVTRYCYNCGGKGHYGDECPTLPESSQSQQSVFSFSSLSISHDPRRHDRDHNHGQYHHRSSNSSSKRPRHHSSSESRHRHSTHHRWDDRSDSDSDRPAKRPIRRDRTKEMNKQRFDDRLPARKYDRQETSNSKKHGSWNGQQQTSDSKERGSGNNNWKALKGTSSSSSSRAERGTRIENDFPRNLPKPSFSGVIDTEPASRRPRYTGGYNRHG